MANKSIEVDEFVHEQDDSRLVNDQIADVPKEISISPKDQQISSSKDQGQIPSLMSLDWGQIPSLMSLDRGQIASLMSLDRGQIPSLMSLDRGQIPSLMSLDRGQLFNKVRQPIGRIDDDNYLYGRTEVIIN